MLSTSLFHSCISAFSPSVFHVETGSLVLYNILTLEKVLFTDYISFYANLGKTLAIFNPKKITDEEEMNCKLILMGKLKTRIHMRIADTLLSIAKPLPTHWLLNDAMPTSPVTNETSSSPTT